MTIPSGIYLTDTKELVKLYFLIYNYHKLRLPIVVFVVVVMRLIRIELHDEGHAAAFKKCQEPVGVSGKHGYSFPFTNKDVSDSWYKHVKKLETR